MPPSPVAIPPLIIHTMIGNSGGMSFSNALVGSVIPAEAVLYKDPSELTVSDLATGLYLHGHFPPAQAPFPGGRTAANLILFRSPVRKFISDYNWLRGFYITGSGLKDTGNPPPEVNRANVSAEFVDSLSSLDNYAAFLEGGTDEGVCTVSRWLRQFLPDELAAIPPGPDFTAAAVTAVRRRYRFIGITEFFEEAIFDLCRQMSWPPPAPWIRVGIYSPSALSGNLEARTLERIKRVIADDLAIYAALRADAESHLEAFSFDEEFLRYKAGATVSDAKLLEAFLRFDTEYLPAALRHNQQAMQSFSKMVMDHLAQPKIQALETKIEKLEDRIEAMHAQYNDLLRRHLTASGTL